MRRVQVHIMRCSWGFLSGDREAVNGLETCGLEVEEESFSVEAV